MSAADFEQMIQRYHDGVDAFVKGDPDSQKALWSHRDDVTLANPVAPPARGWSQVELTLDRAAAQLRDGEPCRFEGISEYVSGDLAYTLEIQRTRVRFADENELRPISLRVTTVFRLEEDQWKVVHRHADPLTEERSIESIAE